MNIFTATMPVWIYLLSVIVLLLIIVYFAFVAARHDSMAESIAAEKQAHNDTLNAENTKLREALQEEKAKVKERDLEIERLQKSADHATVPLVEAAPAKPPRGGRGKKQ